MKKTPQDKIDEQVRLAASTFGRMGGTATFKKHGSAYMKKIGKRAAMKRWVMNKKNNKKTTQKTPREV